MPYQPEFTVSARIVCELEAIAVLRERILAATIPESRFILFIWFLWSIWFPWAMNQTDQIN
jgi:hypothetical protein